MNFRFSNLQRLFLLAAFLAFCSAGCSDEERSTFVTARSFDFISHLGEARITMHGNPMIPLHYLGQTQPWTEDDRLFCPAHSQTEIRFSNVPLGRQARLDVGLGLRPGTPDLRKLTSNQTLHFSVMLQVDNRRYELLNRTIDLADLEPGCMIDEVVPLPETDATHGEFIFRSEGSEKKGLYHPVWCGPKLVTLGRDALPEETVTTFQVAKTFLLDQPAPKEDDPTCRSMRVDFNEEEQLFRPHEQGRLLLQEVPARAAYSLVIPGDSRLSVGLAALGSWTKKGSIDFKVLLNGQECFKRSIRLTAQGSAPIRAEIDLKSSDSQPALIDLQTSWSRPEQQGDSQVSALWIYPQIEQVATASRQRAGTGKNIVLMVVDALRADRLSCYGYERNTSPHLDRLAEDHILFENAWAHSSWTIPSTATILTGQYSCTHGLYDAFHWWLASGLATITQVFLEHGLATTGFVANPLISEDHSFSKGFELFQETPFATAAQLNRAFLNWLDSHDNERFFAYLHYMEPHLPYAAPGASMNRYGQTFTEGFEPTINMSESLIKGVEFTLKKLGYPIDARKALDGEPLALLQEVENLYDSEIAYWDDCLGLLLSELKRRNLFDNTMIVITSDHGEEFLEHGMFRHGQSLHRELLHVPLIIANTGQQPERRTDQVGLIDVAPTLLALAGTAKTSRSSLEALTGFAGFDLFGRPANRDLLFADTAHGLRRFDAPDMVVQRAVFSQSDKGIMFLDDNSLTLFDRTADPYERKDLAASRPEQVRIMKELIQEWVNDCRKKAPYHLSLFDASALEKLREMGYVR